MWEKGRRLLDELRTLRPSSARSAAGEGTICWELLIGENVYDAFKEPTVCSVGG